MKLQADLQSDFAKLAKEKNNPKKELLKVVLAELSRYKSKDVPDDEVIRIIKKMKDDAIECGNFDEVPILEYYLPKMFEEYQIRKVVRDIIELHQLSGIKDMSKAMMYLKESKDASLIDKSIAIKLVKEMLG